LLQGPAVAGASIARPANLRKTIEIVPDEGATIPDLDPFRIMRGGGLMELGFLDLHVEPTSTQSTRLPDSNLASDDQCAAIAVSG